MSGDKKRWPHMDVLPVAFALKKLLSPVVAQVEIAGSLRRRSPLVGDIELVYIPRREDRPAATPDLLNHVPMVSVDLVDELIRELERAGLLARRLNVDGRESFGPLNKLMVHVPTGIPVDFFATDRTCWWNSLVCRTGGAENNRAIARAALSRGLNWKPYGPGFDPVGGRGKSILMHSEAEVFATAGLPYLEPWERS